MFIYASYLLYNLYYIINVCVGQLYIDICYALYVLYIIYLYLVLL
jgi:hypothetical protein